jgi:hypothetical protein
MYKRAMPEVIQYTFIRMFLYLAENYIHVYSDAQEDDRVCMMFVV